MKTLAAYREQARESLKNYWWKAMGALIVVSACTDLPSYLENLFPTEEAEWLWIRMILIVASVLLIPFSLGYPLSILTHARTNEGNFLKNTYLHTKKIYGKLMGIVWWMALIVCAIAAVAGGALYLIGLLPMNEVLEGVLIAVLGIITLLFIFKVLYGYAVAEFLVHDDPTLKTREALRKSTQMMQGKKLLLLKLYLSILHWMIYPAFVLGLVCGVYADELTSLELAHPLLIAIAAILAVIIVTLFVALLPYCYIATAHFYEDLTVES